MWGTGATFLKHDKSDGHHKNSNLDWVIIFNKKLCDRQSFDLFWVVSLFACTWMTSSACNVSLMPLISPLVVMLYHTCRSHCCQSCCCSYCMFVRFYIYCHVWNDPTLLYSDSFCGFGWFTVHLWFGLSNVLVLFVCRRNQEHLAWWILLLCVILEACYWVLQYPNLSDCSGVFQVVSFH